MGQRAADAYVDTEAIRLTAWQAAWRLAEGLPATTEVAVAKYWADEGGQRVVHAAPPPRRHGRRPRLPAAPLLPPHKHIELTLGGATESLLRLGRMLAAEPV